VVPDIEIRDQDLHDTDALRAAFPELRAAALHERDDMPFWGEREFVSMMQTELPDIRRRLLLAYDGGRVVGGAYVVVPTLDNLDKLYLHITVHPAARRLGLGSALEARARELARRESRSTIIGEAHVPAERRDDHAARRFAEAHGYALANVEIARALDLPVSDELLDACAAEAAPFHHGYRLETFDGPIPEGLAESFCILLGLLATEAPTGDLDFEPEVVPVEALRAREKASEEQGRTVYTTVAIDSSGDAVADTMLKFSPDDPANAMQWATLVRSDHRGRRLGLAIKVRNLRTLQAAHPEVRRVWTQNAEVNDHMVAINERLGFKPVEMVLEFQRKEAVSEGR
jgi:GNAT superfamily N-acetyltransferase